MMYKVEVRIPDLVLEELTTEEFEQLRDCRVEDVALLLGFVQHPYTVERWCDYPWCDRVFTIYTKEVAKPTLFGHALAYTAEAL